MTVTFTSPRSRSKRAAATSTTAITSATELEFPTLLVGPLNYSGSNAAGRMAYDREFDKVLEMLPKLPGWVVDDVTSVRREVNALRGTTEAERWRLAKLCSRDAMWAIRASGMSRRILDQVDPMPESSIRALQRLRERAGWGRDGR